MHSHQSQAELMNLLKELLEPFVFGDPCLYLGKEVLRDVNTACPVPGPFEGKVLARVQGATVMAATGGMTAAMGVGVEGGGQDR
jgi:hypothetical protein